MSAKTDTVTSITTGGAAAPATATFQTDSKVQASTVSVHEKLIVNILNKKIKPLIDKACEDGVGSITWPIPKDSAHLADEIATAAEKEWSRSIATVYYKPPANCHCDYGCKCPRGPPESINITL